MARFSVLVDDGAALQSVRTKDLQFTKTDRGGYQSATLTVPEYINSTNQALAAGSKLSIYDRAARTVFQGYLDLPGKSKARDQGDLWKIGVLGAGAVLSDKSAPYISIDSSLDGFFQRIRHNTSARVEVGAVPGSSAIEQALVISLPGGSVIGNSFVGAMYYQQIADAGQELGGFGYTRTAGLASINYQFQPALLALDGTPSTQILATVPDFSTSTVVMGPYVVGTNWTTGADILRLGVDKSAGGATTITVDTLWGAFSDVYVVARRLLADGTNAPNADHGNAYVLAHEVITDAAQRLTSLLDMTNASIDTTFTYHIDQLAYPDGVTMQDLLADVALLEPDLTYGVFESGALGTHRFKVGKYGSSVRYVASTIDGWEQPGGESSLSNELTVYYTDKRGRTKSVTVTTPIPELDEWGRVRSAEPVDLGTEAGTAAAATQVADGLLAQANTFPFAGTLTVARPILDQTTGRMVQPWEIEPGNLLQVQDLTDSPPMRLTEMTYTDSSASASLTLGTPTYDTDELVAKLAKRRHRKGGRPVAASYA